MTVKESCAGWKIRELGFLLKEKLSYFQGIWFELVLGEIWNLKMCHSQGWVGNSRCWWALRCPVMVLVLFTNYSSLAVQVHRRKTFPTPLTLDGPCGFLWTNKCGQRSRNFKDWCTILFVLFPLVQPFKSKCDSLYLCLWMMRMCEASLGCVLDR